MTTTTTTTCADISNSTVSVNIDLTELEQSQIVMTDNNLAENSFSHMDHSIQEDTHSTDDTQIDELIIHPTNLNQQQSSINEYSETLAASGSTGDLWNSQSEHTHSIGITDNEDIQTDSDTDVANQSPSISNNLTQESQLPLKTSPTIPESHMSQSLKLDLSSLRTDDNTIKEQQPLLDSSSSSSSFHLSSKNSFDHVDHLSNPSLTHLPETTDKDHSSIETENHLNRCSSSLIHLNEQMMQDSVQSIGVYPPSPILPQSSLSVTSSSFMELPTHLFPSSACKLYSQLERTKAAVIPTTNTWLKLKYGEVLAVDSVSHSAYRLCPTLGYGFTPVFKLMSIISGHCLQDPLSGKVFLRIGKSLAVNIEGTQLYSMTDVTHSSDDANQTRHTTSKTQTSFWEIIQTVKNIFTIPTATIKALQC